MTDINIDDYLANKIGIKTGKPLSEKTKSTIRFDYVSLFNKFNIVTIDDYKNQRQSFIEYIESKYNNIGTRRAKLNLLSSFERFHNIDSSDIAVRAAELKVDINNLPPPNKEL